MKKIFAMALCLLMLSGSALAGTAPLEVRQLTAEKTLTVVLPEGVKSAEIEDIYGMQLITFELEDETLPTYTLIVSYSETMHEKDITDLTDDEIKATVAFTAMDSEEHSYEVIEMDDGWPAVLIQYEEAESESDWVDAFTIIEGYFIQVHGAHEDFAPLTEAENQFAFTLLDSIDIVTID